MEQGEVEDKIESMDTPSETEDVDESASPLFRSFSMSQSLASSVAEEVSNVIRLNGLTEVASSSRILTSGYDDTDNDTFFYRQQRQELKVSQSFSLSSTYLENSITLPLKRTPSLGGKRNEMLTGIVVSRWDNIVGPQCSYLWTEEMTSLFYPGNLPKHLSRLIKYVTDHTVDHHVADGTLLHSAVKSGLCIVPDLSLVYMFVSIRVPSSDSLGCEIQQAGLTVPHSVAVLADLQYLHHFLLIRPLVTSWLMEFAPKIGVLICKNKLHMSMINSWCAELCKTMAAVRACWWQKSITEKKPSQSNNHRLSENEKTNCLKTSASVTPSEDSEWDYLPPPSSPRSSIEMMITSHLSTSCSTLIIGPNAAAINKVIRFLLCFSRAEEGYCSRYVLPTLPDTFMKGLYVQGLISGEIGEKSISTNQINSNRHPFTHVELNSNFNTKVRRMPIESHHSQREFTLVQELAALWHSSAFRSPNAELFSQPIDESGNFVSKFVTELLILRPELRYGRLLLFRRMVHSKALALITFLHSIHCKPQKDKAELIKRIRETLCLDEAEFLIIQMTAEKIRPGITLRMNAKSNTSD